MVVWDIIFRLNSFLYLLPFFSTWSIFCIWIEHYIVFTDIEDTGWKYLIFQWNWILWCKLYFYPKLLYIISYASLNGELSKFESICKKIKAFFIHMIWLDIKVKPNVFLLSCWLTMYLMHLSIYQTNRPTIFSFSLWCFQSICVCFDSVVDKSTRDDEWKKNRKINSVVTATWIRKVATLCIKTLVMCVMFLANIRGVGVKNVHLGYKMK